ncbi:MAG: hypothetical protein ACFE95_18115 [Candidatus Hodarchaeota archaeon]
MVMNELDLILFILKQICFGSLISGLIIFFLTLFIQGSHLFDHDADLDHDIDHDISLDHGGMDIGHADLDMHADIDIDVDTDVSIGIDKDIHVGIDKDVSVGVDKDVDHGIGDDTPTPLMLLLGTFMITFGGSGTILLNSATNPFLSVLFTFVLPIGVTLIVSKLWSKIAVSEIYDTALETIKIDDTVKTLTNVDTDGGLVVIVTSSIHGPIKMAAKTRYGAIPKDMTAYVVEVQGNTLIIDEWPSKEGEEKPIPEGTIKWE